MKINFHWRLLQGGELGYSSRSLGSWSPSTGKPDLIHQVAQCKTAEELGIDGLLVDIGADNPDPILLCTGLGLATEKIGLIVAVRSGLYRPTTFVQQINTLSGLIGGERILLNIVAGDSPMEQRFYGDFLDHDQRYARTEEFLTICRGLWQSTRPLDYAGQFFRVEGAKLNTPFMDKDRDHPLMFVAGGSDPCRDLSISQGSCWMQLADSPSKIAERAKPVLAAGKQVGVRLAVIVRPTQARAREAARALVSGMDVKKDEKKKESSFLDESDSVSMKATYTLAENEWLTPTLWTGAIRTHGSPSICLVGDPDQVAEAFMDFREAGVSHFILSGWPKLDEMIYFGSEVIPRVRKLEECGGLRPVTAATEAL